MTIVEFLLARIEEDEGAARRAEGQSWFADGTWYLDGVKHDVVGPDEVAFTHPEFVDHIATHHPARVLAECQAKRRLIDLHPIARRYVDDLRLCDDPDKVEPVAAGWDIPVELRILAEVYRDHPDFQQGWGVE